MSRLEHLANKVRDAVANDSPSGLSTGEALAAALILNRADWLAKMGYTIAEALDRIDNDWIPLIPQVAGMVAKADAAMKIARESAREQAAMEELAGADEVVDVNATLVTYGNAPGYRSVSLTFDLERLHTTKKYRVCLHIQAKDGFDILRHIVDIHQSAWRNGKPIDGKNEDRPVWLDRLHSVN